jgi:hypothetical protein
VILDQFGNGAFPWLRSVPGQMAKYSLRANIVRCCPGNRHHRLLPMFVRRSIGNISCEVVSCSSGLVEILRSRVTFISKVKSGVHLRRAAETVWLWDVLVIPQR